MTYGQLITEANRHLHQVLAQPVNLHSPEDAITACQARALLYRVTAGALALHLHLPGTVGGHWFVDYRGDGIKRREATLLAYLRQDLLNAAATAPHPIHTPHPTSPTTTRLSRAADAAGAAFDLLAGHLRPVDASPVANSSPLRRGGTRTTARDAVLLARTITRLDSRLERPLRAQARHAPDEPTRDRLLTVADDCKRVTHHGVRQFASVLHDMLRSRTRHLVDDLDIARPTFTWPPTASPSAAANLVAHLRNTTRKKPNQLSLLDLAAIASAGARACLLIAYASASIGGPTGRR